jgi:hypothetical protein
MIGGDQGMAVLRANRSHPNAAGRRPRQHPRPCAEVTSRSPAVAHCGSCLGPTIAVGGPASVVLPGYRGGHVCQRSPLVVVLHVLAVEEVPAVPDHPHDLVPKAPAPKSLADHQRSRTVVAALGSPLNRSTFHVAMSDPVAGPDYPNATADFLAWFRYYADCRDYLEWARWPDGTCVHCGRLRRQRVAARRRAVHVHRVRRPHHGSGGHDLRSDPYTFGGSGSTPIECSPHRKSASLR